MLQLTPHRRIFLAVAPVDFRKGLEGLVAVCRQAFAQNPLSGGLYGFRHRTGTALKVLYYDGQGYWLCLKRFSAGRLRGWPRAGAATVRRAARELQVLLWNGYPAQAAMADDWRHSASADARFWW